MDLRVVVAPDSFKGSITSVAVARAFSDGWLRVRPDDTIVLAPLADGGEGTLAAIEAAGGWNRRTCPAHDALGGPLGAPWLVDLEARHAIVEMAAASGLSHLDPKRYDPEAASSFGTGEVIRAALDAGIRRIDLGVGGSATTDGGKGILLALGLEVTESPLQVRVDTLDTRLGEVDLRIACDVTNPLLGPTGAAAVYAPQKGATPVQVRQLDVGLSLWADALENATGRHERETPGAGAAGGATFGLACVRDRFRSFQIVPGVDLVMGAISFCARLEAADLVITGEGRIDAQTAFGKTAFGVAKRAASLGVPCIALGGAVETEGMEALAGLGAIAVCVSERPQSVEVAMAAGVRPICHSGERLAQLVSLGAWLSNKAPNRLRR